MLLEFTVRNFRSFAEAATLSMVASDQKAKDPETDVANCIELPDGRRVLSNALIYGANASGKSNLYKAFSAFLHLFRKLGSGDWLPTEPFRLRTDLRDAPSEFEVVAWVEGQQYRYGLEVTAQAVIAEWLYVLHDGEEQPLFERKDQVVDLSPSLAHAEPLKQFVAPEKAFAWVAKEFNIEVIRRFIDWTQERIWALEPLRYSPLQHTIDELERHSEQAQAIVNLIQRLDVGIAGIEVRSRQVEPTNVELDTLLSSRIKEQEDSDALEATDIETMHRVYDLSGAPAEEARFSLWKHESTGTQKLIALAGPLVDAAARGCMIFVDEFDARLHPNLSRELLALFRSPAALKSGAQLIATTHDTHLLDHRTLRRDQIWFVEKDRRGESELFSLADIKGVRNDERYEKRYLSGRYGGVPFPGDLASVIPESDKDEAE